MFHKVRSNIQRLRKMDFFFSYFLFVINIVDGSLLAEKTHPKRYLKNKTLKATTCFLNSISFLFGSRENEFQQLLG